SAVEMGHGALQRLAQIGVKGVTVSSDSGSRAGGIAGDLAQSARCQGMRGLYQLLGGGTQVLQVTRAGNQDFRRGLGRAPAEPIKFFPEKIADLLVTGRKEADLLGF